MKLSVLHVRAKTSSCPPWTICLLMLTLTLNRFDWFRFGRILKTWLWYYINYMSINYVLWFASVVLSAHWQPPDQPCWTNPIILFYKLCLCSRVFWTPSSSSPPSSLYISNYPGALWWPRCRYTMGSTVKYWVIFRQWATPLSCLLLSTNQKWPIIRTCSISTRQSL